MQMAIPRGRVNYEPNSLGVDSPREVGPKGPAFRSFQGEEDGTRGRIRSESFADHYSQARMFYRSQSEIEQAHIASALVFELSKVEHPHVREAIVRHLRRIEESLAKRVAMGLGMSALPAPATPAAAVKTMKPSPATALIGKMKATLEGRTVGILVNDGSDAKKVAAIQKAVLAAGATPKLVAPKVSGIKLTDGSTPSMDGQLAGTPSVVFDAVAVILSATGAKQLSTEGAAVDFVRDAFGHLKAIAVDAGGADLLRAAGVDPDDAVIPAERVNAFIAAAKTRAWTREPNVRTLA